MESTEAATRLEDVLVERLAEWARNNWPDERAFALGLVFTIGMTPLPAPGLGTAPERDEWLADPDEYGVGLMIWNPAEYEVYNPDFTDALGAEAMELAEKLNDA